VRTPSDLATTRDEAVIGSHSEDPGRSSRRAALKLLGGSAGVGALLAAGPARTEAWLAQSTPVATDPTVAATPPPAAADSLFYRLGAAPPVEFASGASVQFARATEFPALSGLSLAVFEVGADATREMHWHNNAGELGWCLGGEGQMVLLDEAGAAVSFPLDPGSVFFAPKGLPHAFWTTGDEPLRILLGFDHQQPATIDFSQMMPPLPAAVIARAAGVALSDVPSFPTVAKPFAVPVPGGTATLASGADDPGAARYTVRLGELVEATAGRLGTSGATAADIPSLVGIKTTLMTLEPGVLSEPHWHPAADEVCFVLAGQVEVGIVGPNGASQTEILTSGDLAFIPVNWLHYVDNIGEEPAQVILFHDATASIAITLSQVLSGFPPAILAASYGMDPAALAALAAGDPQHIPGLPA
jgi:oxalate decarboxylase